jgi:hypothetical protein
LPTLLCSDCCYFCQIKLRGLKAFPIVLCSGCSWSHQTQGGATNLSHLTIFGLLLVSSEQRGPHNLPILLCSACCQSYQTNRGPVFFPTLLSSGSCYSHLNKGGPTTFPSCYVQAAASPVRPKGTPQLFESCYFQAAASPAFFPTLLCSACCWASQTKGPCNLSHPLQSFTPFCIQAFAIPIQYKGHCYLSHLPFYILSLFPSDQGGPCNLMFRYVQTASNPAVFPTVSCVGCC